MRTAGIIVVIIGVPLGLFGIWGYYMPSGRRHFDEMAGIIPFFSMFLAAFFVVAGAAILFWKRAG